MILCMALIDEPKHIPLFEEIYYRYRAAMFGIAVAVLRDHHLAEDAVSEAFIKIAKNMNKIASLAGQAQKDYIVILTRNSALDIYRRRSKQAGLIDYTEELPEPGVSQSPEDMLFAQDTLERLIQAIQDLPAIYRDTLKLYYLYEHAASEVADILGITTEVVFARLSRGRKKLAERLKKEGVEP